MQKPLYITPKINTIENATTLCKKTITKIDSSCDATLHKGANIYTDK